MGRRKWKYLPSEVRREVIRLAAMGKTIMEICAEADVGMGTVARVVGPMGGVFRPGQWSRSEFRLSPDERVEIALGLARNETFSAIAARLGRAVSTISREVNGHGGRRHYRPGAAQRSAEAAARRPKQTKLAANPRLCERVSQDLEKLRSPQQISKRLRREFGDDPSMTVSHETIYKSLYVQGRGELRRELAACLRTGRAARKKQGRPERRSQIPAMVNISERPPEAADRAVPGHWEGDLLIGKGGASAVGTLVERSTRFVMLLHLPKGRGAADVREAMAAKILTLPEALRRSITWDQGREMAEHARFTVDTGVQIYFCDPRSPWQRGSNENTNGLLRQYMPKGTSLRSLSADDLDAIADSLNDRPRETLDWMTPSEKLNEVLVALTG